MIRLIFRFIFWLNKWSVDDALVKKGNITRCVMIGAPHTSNWDMVYMITAFEIMGLPLKFTVKKSLMIFPLNILIGPLGGIGIDRSPKDGSTERRSMVEVMTELFKNRENMVIVFSPEGTRSLRDKWRTGFYHTAVNAKVPILLGYLDYKNKIAGVGKIIYPSDDMGKVMREMMKFYSNITPCHPELFSLDKEYVD